MKSLTLKNQKAYSMAKNWGMKSDILRYEILQKFGGVYIDTDYECVLNIGMCKLILHKNFIYFTDLPLRANNLQKICILNVTVVFLKHNFITINFNSTSTSVPLQIICVRRILSLQELPTQQLLKSLTAFSGK